LIAIAYIPTNSHLKNVKSEVFAAAGAADDGSLAVVYSGNWLAGAFRPAFCGTLTYSDQAGAMARFSFEGAELQYT
jgi:hypothetical protein